MGHRRVGVVGVGRWGGLIVRDLVRLGSEVIAVARSPQSIMRARDAGALQVIGSVDELSDVDGVIVAVPIHLHAEIVETVLELGVPVFVEKPMTDDPDRADDLARRCGDRLFVMDKWRYHPGIEELARIASSGELGQVVGLHTARREWGNAHPDSDSVWVLAPHDLAITLEILGDVPSARLALGFTFEDGIVGLRAALGVEPWVILDVGGVGLDRTRRIEMFCEHGVAWLDDAYSDHVGVARSPMIGTDGWERRAIGAEMPLLRELRTFLDHLVGGPAPRSSASDGALIVRRIAEMRQIAGLSP